MNSILLYDPLTLLLLLNLYQRSLNHESFEIMTAIVEIVAEFSYFFCKEYKLAPPPVGLDDTTDFDSFYIVVIDENIHHSGL